MDQKWTLHIEGFGKIKSADIEISPMMLFIGDNNSGKSYVMSLLWGIFALSDVVFDPRNVPDELYMECIKWLECIYDQGQVVIDDNAYPIFLNLFNELLALNKDLLIGHTFNHPIKIDCLRVLDYHRKSPFIIEKLELHPLGFKVEWSKSSISKRVLSAGETEMRIKKLLINELIWILFFCDFPFYNPLFTAREPIYLPASRTGFMLTYKSLIQNLIGTSFLGGNFELKNDQGLYKNTFPFPIIRFLQKLVDINFETERYKEIVGFLEQEALNGTVKKEGETIPTYLYQPTGTNTVLPPHITSSLVTELMPIILMLKSDFEYNLMIIEEPEAHLHPQVQKKIINALVRLLNSGLSVWVTTHSDVIFQQVNNMIKLHNHPDKFKLAEQYGYIEKDFLDPELVRAYQFTVDDAGNTVVEQLKLHAGGFAVPTFNNTIISLSQETIRFQEIDLDDEDCVRTKTAMARPKLSFVGKYRSSIGREKNGR